MGRLAGLLLVLLRCSSAASLARRDLPAERNDRPIIGILSQECHFDEYQKFGRSYIAASYVKFVESAGARAVPISPRIQRIEEGYRNSPSRETRVQFCSNYGLNLTDEDYDKIFHSINGVLFPGGGVDLQTSEYARVAKLFYHKALEANDRGDYFPIWGTCLGHEELTYLTSGEILLVHTKTNGFSLPLNFTSAAKDSKIFRNFPDDVLHALATEPLTSNFHMWSLSMENFTNNEKLSKFYNVLTTNTDDEVEFISTMEAYKYPIYGMQWHPEKNPFEWKDSPGIPHSPSAVRAAFYMADFFVNEARLNWASGQPALVEGFQSRLFYETVNNDKNEGENKRKYARKSLHHFSSEDEEARELIYNYNPVYTGTFSAFQQTYFFD